MAYREIYENRLARFMRLVVINKTTGCYEWQGAKTKGGYGIAVYKGKNMVAHRAFWLFLGKDIPEKHDLDHLCRNRGCVNPDHLEPVSRSANLRRGFEARGCINGHEFSEEGFSVVNHKDGTTQRRCKICHRERNKLSKRNKTANEKSLRTKAEQ